MASLIDLKGFPMAFCYTEAMLNNQIKLHRESMFPSSLYFEQDKDEWEEDQEDPDWKFDVKEFASPEISFDVPQLQNGAKLNIKIIDGKFGFWAPVGRRGMEFRNLDLGAHTLSIVTPVKMRRHEDFSDANFQIQSIYADLSQVESASIMFDDSREIKVNSTIKAGLEGIIKRGLRDWVDEYSKSNKGELPMVFGGTKIPKVIDSDYRLKPTGCTYSVTQKRDRNQMYISGALNMLLQIDGVEMDNSPAAGAFDVPLPRGNLNEGVLVVSSYALSKKIMLPAMMMEYDNRYLFEARHSSNESNGDFILAKPVTDHKARGVRITTKRIEGELVPGAYRIFIDLDATSFHWSGCIGSTSRNYVDLHFSLDNGRLQVTKGKMQGKTDHNESLILRILGDIITLGFDEILRCIREWDIGSQFGGSIHNIGEDIEEAMQFIILPGGKTGVFDYVDVKVSEEPAINGYANLFLYAKFDGLDGKSNIGVKK